MSPSGGLMTTVESCITWSPVNSVFLLEQVAQVVGSVPRRVDRAQRDALVEHEALAAGQRHGGREAWSLPLGWAAMRPWTTAPVRSASSTVAGEWSVCVWVAKIQRTVPGTASSTLSTCSGSNGPGSMTAHSLRGPPPTR